MRALKASTYTLRSPVFVASDEETGTDCDTTPTCAVTRLNGTALTAATVTNLSGEAGIYTAAITTTHTAQLDRLQILWTGTVSGHVQLYRQELEVVGSHWCTIPEIRGDVELASSAKYPKLLVEGLRDGLVDQIEDYCGTAFTRRYQRDVFDGNSGKCYMLSRPHPRTLISVTVNGTAQTVGDFTLTPDGFLIWDTSTFTAPDSTNGYSNVAVEYEHGYDSPPERLRREAVREIARQARATLKPPSADKISDTSPDGFTTRFSTPDRTAGRPTGNIALDAAMNEFSERAPGVA